MGYRVAVVQNENELLRYSYADARHLLTEERYTWSYYTSENIDTLSSELNSYDAVIVCTNSFNHRRILHWFTSNAEMINQFAVDKGRGLLVLFQMALCDDRNANKPFPFLDEPYDVWGRSRFTQGEAAGDGNFSSRPNFLLDFPTEVNVATLEVKSRNNTNAPGLYWGYFEKYRPESYVPVIYAQNSERGLLLCSRPETNTRIVLSSLVLDWQRHDDLWHNCVRYVVEGRPRTLILRPKGTSRIETDLLCRELWQRKSSYWEIFADSIKGAPEGPPYSSIVLDPTWTTKDITAYLKNSQASRVAEHQNLHFFTNEETGEAVTCSISKTSDLALTVNRACSWLQAQFDTEAWEGSFWSTYDVLELFEFVGITLGDVRYAIASAIYRRLQPNGSYDDVFGATCAVLQVLTWLDLKDDRYRKALDYVLEQLSSQNLYNRATALEIFIKISESLPQPTVARTIEEIEQSVGRWTPGLETIRFMRTLITCGRIETCLGQVPLLREAANGAEEWLSVYGAADTTLILLDLYSMSTLSSGSSQVLIDSLYEGVSFLSSEIDQASGSWKESIVATAKAAHALSAFEHLLRAPLADLPIRLSWAATQSQEGTATHILIERNAQISSELYQTRADLVVEQAKVPELEAKKKPLENYTIISIAAFYILILGCISEAIWLTGHGHKFIRWAKDWQQLSIPAGIALAILPLAVISIVLSEFDRSPRWYRYLQKLIPKLGESEH